MFNRDANTTEISTKRKFSAMAGTYCLGVFNDNFFKQAVLVIAVTTGLNHLQGPATILFALPFILFSAYAGWFADRFAKRKVVIGAKFLEIVAMAVGAYGLLSGNWTCVLAMVFLMGAQSTFFNPALNGSIPELFPKESVPKANGMLKLFTTLSILTGIALAGVALDLQLFKSNHFPAQYAVVAAGVVLTSILGFMLSFGVHSSSPAPIKRPFPWSGPLHSVRIVREARGDSELFLAYISYFFFYFVASLAILAINSMSIEVLGLSQTATSLMSTSLMLGVSIGAVVVGQKMRVEKWSRYLLPSASGMGIGLLMAGSVVVAPESVQKSLFSLSLLCTGICGGFFLIPVTSFLQVRPKASEKGKTLAGANFCGFVAILFSGGIYGALEPYCGAPSCLLLLAAVTFFALIVLNRVKHNGVSRSRIKSKAGRPVLGFLLRSLIAIRYRVKVSGMDELDLDEDKPILFLPNHPALMDPIIVMSHLFGKFSPRPLSDRDQVSKPIIKQVMSLVDPILLPNPRKNGRRSADHVRKAMDTVVSCLKKNEQIILYPAGRLYRSKRESLSANSAVETIVREVSEVQVVLIRTSGLWGSSFSWANEANPSLFKHFLKNFWAVLSAGIFFLPKREVRIELAQDKVVTHLTGRKAINHHLEEFYNREVLPNTTYPLYWWKGRQPEVLPEPGDTGKKQQVDGISQTIRDQVLSKLSELSGQEVKGGEHLSNDLGMDSLTLMDCVAWLEAEYGVLIEDNAALVSVEDCLMAASGKLQQGADNGDTSRVPENWWKSEERDLDFSKAKNITGCFLDQLSRSPERVIFCDSISGAKTYRDVATSIFALKPLFTKEEQDNLGVMLPASASAAITYLATLFSGKTPVMFNWTSGIANMAHAAEMTETKTIITARKLYERIEEQQGVNLADLKVKWVFLEDIAAGLSPVKKMMAAFRGRFLPHLLKKADIQETAAILFTSGSESKPKGVPLSHANILQNMQDFGALIQFSSEDKVLGMLPPFHSLGLVGTMILPVCTGLRVVYHANPTESTILARMIEQYQVTHTIGTPTFIEGIVQSGNTAQLASLQLIFTGAEKCPAHVYDLVEKKLQGATICEGYGITECSPLVSVNSPTNPVRETIGTILPSLDSIIIDPETNKPVDPGQKGILLLRGGSVFQGYVGCDRTKGFREYQGQLWYDTGDFVKQQSDGNLVFCGRLKRFVKLGGEMISLPAVEAVLQEEFGSEDGQGTSIAVEASEAQGQAEITLFSTLGLDRETVNRVIRRKGLSPLHNIRKLVKVDEIPLLGSGKTDYQTLKRLALTAI